MKVDAAGNFTGYAWSENLGWIKFSGTTANNATYKVATAGPLAVTLANFSAEAQAGQVLVSWETFSELDNTGFNLYRGLLADGSDRSLLATVPSQAPGSTQGAAYSYADAARRGGPDLSIAVLPVFFALRVVGHMSIEQAPTIVCDMFTMKCMITCIRGTRRHAR